MPVDALGRPEVGTAIKDAISASFAVIPNGKRGALLVIATDDSTRLHLAANINGTWKVAGGIGFRYTERRPSGFVAIEGSW